MRTATARLLTAFTLAAASALATPAARADFIAGNLTHAAATADVASSSSWVGSGFTTDAKTYTVTDAVVNIGLSSGAIPSGAAAKLAPAQTLATDFELQIRSDAQNSPGGVLGTLTTQTIPVAVGNVTFTPTSLITLHPNTTYWLTSKVTIGTVYWSSTIGSSSDPGAAGTIVSPNSFAISSDQGATWATDTGPSLFRVDGTTAPVPEPSSFALFGIAAACSVLYASRHRRGGA